MPKHDESEFILIGVYDSDIQAQQAIGRLCLKNGFSDYPEGFEISEYELNKDHWTEGFIMDS